MFVFSLKQKKCEQWTNFLQENLSSDSMSSVLKHSIDIYKMSFIK